MNKFLSFLFLLFSSSVCFAQSISDEVAEGLPKAVKQPRVYADYNFESTNKVPVCLKVVEGFKSEEDLYEGQFVDFKVAKDVLYNDKVIIARGTPVLARVAVVISPGLNGIPASVIFKDFEIEKLFKGQLSDTYEIFGQDRSLWVFPLKWALTILPPSGSFTNLIMGGHAKLSVKKHITINYYPDWM